MSVFTIGYEGLGIDVFKALLAERGIETVVDIREVPWSRKPGFSKQPLESALRLAGIGCVHMVALGLDDADANGDFSPESRVDMWMGDDDV